MCTVTVIPLGDAGFRLVTNRDERRERPAALPPHRIRLDGAPFDALWPIDPAGGGTWVGVNERGVSATTLNLNESPDTAGPRPTPARSRGSIVPAILAESTATGAAAALRALDLHGLLPFRLVIVDRDALWTARWNGADLSLDRAELTPVCLVSSGLGDALVAPRLDLFRRAVLDPGPTAALQDAFHDHQWADRPEISVRMERAAARTVSRTIVEVLPGAVSMRYTPLGGAPSTISIERPTARTGAGA
jgi:hypothetical protein